MLVTACVLVDPPVRYFSTIASSFRRSSSRSSSPVVMDCAPMEAPETEDSEGRVGATDVAVRDSGELSSAGSITRVVRDSGFCPLLISES